MIREFLRVVIESSYGTFKASPVAGTEAIYVRLDGDNSFSMQANPVQVPIARGGGFAVNALHLSGRTEVSGRLTTKLYSSQALFWLNMCAARVGAGQTTPWTTTEPVGDLPSVSIYHAYAAPDNVTYKRTRYAGCKVGAWTLSGSDRDPYWTLSMDLVGQKPVGNAQDASSDPNSTEFPTVTDANLPTDPYLWRHTTFNLGGSARAEIKGFSLSVRNALDGNFYASRWLSSLRFFGRASTFDAELLLQLTPDDRAAYEALTALASSLVLFDGTRTTTLQLRGQNRLTQLGRNLPLATVSTWRLQGANLWDAAAGEDLSFTVV